MSIRFKAVIFFILIVSFLLFKPTVIHAQNQQGITVMPSIIHIDLATDPSEYEITYINNTNAEINLLLSVQDFTELEDSYKIDFLTGKSATNYKYSLSSWISFENNNLFLNPGEKKTVKVFIDKNRITKGGHYASILAKIVQPKDKTKISVNAVLSSLLFVRASTGKEIEIGKISDFKPLRDGLDYPDTYILRFENNGNVHVIPYGSVTVFDPLENLVARGALNEDSLDALPESIRRYDTKVITYQKLLLPGIYTAKIDINFGKSNQKLTSTTKFFSQGMFDFAKIGLVLMVLIIISLYLRQRMKNRTPKQT